MGEERDRTQAGLEYDVLLVGKSRGSLESAAQDSPKKKTRQPWKPSEGKQLIG